MMISKMMQWGRTLLWTRSPVGLTNEMSSNFQTCPRVKLTMMLSAVRSSSSKVISLKRSAFKSQQKKMQPQRFATKLYLGHRRLDTKLLLLLFRQMAIQMCRFADNVKMRFLPL